MKITDKMRLDFLTKKGTTSLFYNHAYMAWGYGGADFSPCWNTPRQAIGAAIRQERRKKP